MSTICVNGMNPLRGRIRNSGAKNAVLPIIGAALLTQEPVVIEDCPHLVDVDNMLAIMESLGCSYEWSNLNEVTIDPQPAHKWEMPESLSNKLRSSIFMLGPVIARFKKARFTYPGGCEIGQRPIDLHIKGLRSLNVIVEEKHGYINCDGSNMRGADISLDSPSVGATENIMMAAVAATGPTMIRNAAREPEIVDLQNFLRLIGANVKGAGSSTITIDPTPKLFGARHKLLSDRIVAGTYMVAAAITGGDITIDNVQPDHLHSVLSKLKEAGCKIDIDCSTVRIIGPKRPKEMQMLETQPYPGFPTDMQAQMFALASVAEGTCFIVENVFDNRFKHAGELACMGAISTIKDRTAVVRGVASLTGAEVRARDLRGGAAMVLAGLRASGTTRVLGAEFIDRGYEKFDEALRSLGADIWRE